jgi:UDPglucose 6-dehydrogenase/GDP-mannose 6-dehydrogenase
VKVAVVGCGYVGLVSGIGLAKLGHEVTGIDVDDTRLARISAGETPFHEPGLPEALARTLADGSFAVSDSLADAVSADVVLLCVQTPASASGGIDVSFLVAAASGLADAIGEEKEGRRVVAVRSTVPPGTTEGVVTPLLGRPGLTAVVSNPEFLREGSALDDFLQADRVVVGTREPWAAELMAALYAPLEAPLIVTTPAAAELAKYASNALLATAVSFSNEIGRLAEATPGVDVEDVLRILHHDRRLNLRAGGETVTAPFVAFLKAGCGYGGSCLPKDLAGLIDYGHGLGESTQLLEAVAAINHTQAARLVGLAERALGGVDGRLVAVLGAAFKAGTDDLRDSPALRIVDELLDRRAEVVVYDRLVARERLEAALPEGVSVADDLETAVSRADACLVTTNDPEFQTLPELVKRRDGGAPFVVDGRRYLSPESFPKDRYAGIGRAAT